MTKIAFAYPPGKYPTQREYHQPDAYNERQEAIWQAINTFYWAWHDRRVDTLMPSPGSMIDRADYEAWMAKQLAAWRNENSSRGRGWMRGLVRNDAPETAWQWLYQRIRAVPPKPQTNA